MNGPARAGAVIYAKQVGPLTAFYRELLGAQVLHAEPAYAVVQSADIQLVIHAIPEAIARTFDIAVPPEPREEAAIKLFFTVPHMDGAREAVTRLGGIWNANPWSGDGFIACNAVDPEGNVFQVRVITSAR